MRINEDLLNNKVDENNACKFVVINDLGYKNENKAIGEYEDISVALHPNDKGMREITDRITKLM